jgi:DNA-binding NarL/FixJ family response regulator
VRNFLPPLSNEETERIARRWAEGVPIESHRAFRTIEQEIDLTDTLGAIDIPVLILKVLPRSQAEFVAALIRNSILLERHSGRLSRRLREQWDQYIGSQFADPPQAAGAGSNGLSPREREVLSLLAAGRTNTEIAAGLCLSIRTVERHARNIYTKLGVHNRVEAANWAREHGVV